MTWKGNLAQLARPEHIALLADERVAAEPRLNPHLVPPAGVQPHLEE